MVSFVEAGAFNISLVFFCRLQSPFYEVKKGLFIINEQNEIFFSMRIF